METVKLVLSRKEAAAYLGISINTIDKHPEIPRHKIGSRTLFRKENLDRFVLENEKGVTKCKK